MYRPSAARIRVDSSGGMEIVDPGFAELPLIRAIDPDWPVRSATLPGFVRPNILQLREFRTALEPAMMEEASLEALWDIHDKAMSAWRAGRVTSEGGLSLMTVKAVIARRLLSACPLCIRRCGADRAGGQRGLCGLAADAHIGEHFVHIAEEPPINPSLVLNLRGCALRCRGCQQHALLDPRAPDSERLEPGLWHALDFTGARSLSLVGGNPDESLAAILEFLAAAPADFALPIVWNNNGAMSAEAFGLVEGVADAYVPDLKFHAENCARQYTHVAGYPVAARASIADMVGTGLPVIVRVLLLPGHGECCNLPSLAWLASLAVANLRVSLRAQYAPDWRINARDGALADRVTRSELEQAVDLARTLALPLFDDGAMTGASRYS